ncbi:hypothetical protein G7Z17_g1060 [Cylindrodendrum hubeiense]|uniref:Carboxylic ester hydrolase n=1 Tax=Cylindrodendrum hubeiense TaxID=595255 RepID=A0A9P5HQZ5_9HYPO|nr:hypothetical protein G7Z17_g1060 [Cylindrodendrum hubeiense]
MKLSSIVGTLCAAGCAFATATVSVKNGTYQGFSVSSPKQDHFLGIPYAQAPVGSLRFRGPHSLNSTWKGAKKVVKFGNACMQYTSVKAGKPILVVSINYRLSAFGFLWGSNELKAIGSANNGLRDQRLALHWIQENIAAFGGDPAKVTIFGQSGGGLSVGKQLIAYDGRDDNLFRAAIMQSGSMNEKWPYNVADPVTYMEDLYQNLTVTTGCANKRSELECLRNLPLEQLSEALNITNTAVFSGTGLGPWLTVVDGDFLTNGPTESLLKGHFNMVPVMHTTTTDEASVFGFTDPVNTDSEFRAFVAAGGPDSETIDIIETLYPDVNALGLPAGYEPPNNDTTFGLQYKRVNAYHTDVVETASRRMTVDTWAATGGTAYSGRINILIPGSSAALGSHHAVELDLVFNTIDSDNKEIKKMSKLMSRMWASFVADLDPNNHGLTGYPSWPTRNVSNVDGVGSNFVFDTDGSSKTESHVEQDDFRLAQTLCIQKIFQSQLHY